MTSLFIRLLAIYLGGIPLYEQTVGAGASQLLSKGPGAESAAMAGTSVSTIHDPTALYWNRLYEPWAVRRDGEIKARLRARCQSSLNRVRGRGSVCSDARASAASRTSMTNTTRVGTAVA